VIRGHQSHRTRVWRNGPLNSKNGQSQWCPALGETALPFNGGKKETLRAAGNHRKERDLKGGPERFGGEREGHTGIWVKGKILREGGKSFEAGRNGEHRDGEADPT